jgi:uncharacterized membrane protein YgcG
MVFIISSSDMQVYSAEENETINDYGLHIRNNSKTLPFWYPEDTSNFQSFHDSDIPRVVDMADIISEKQEEELKQKIAAYSSELNRDIVVVTDTSSYRLGHEKYCYDFYDFNGYGIGRNFEGICLFVCMDPNERGWWVGATGFETRNMYTETLANRLDDKLYEYMSTGAYGEGILDWVDNVYNAYLSYTPRNPASLPDWFPDDVDFFENFHDEDRSRVVDFSGVLSVEEEEELKKKIAKYSAITQKDIVVVLDESDYELGMERYGTCFFEFNGYGIGSGYEGMWLFINTRFNKNEYCSGASGYDTSNLFDQFKYDFKGDISNDLLVNNYFKAIDTWIDRVYAMYAKGFPLAPDWYPTLAEKDNYARWHNADAPRVFESLDGDGAFTSEQEKILEEKAKAISDKYGVDVVIHTTKNNCSLTDERYIGDFYYYNGYGLGEDYNAILFCIYDQSNRITIDTYGRIKDEISEVNYTRLLEQSKDCDNYFDAATVFLDNLDHWERTGRVSRTAGQWGFCAIVTAVVGLVFGRISLKKAKKRMVTVRTAYGADNYISGSSDFKDGTDTFINKTVQRTAIPRYTSSGSGSSRSSSSSSRHHSTYHSSSRGSSGRSHSGSGRRF